MSTPAAPPGGLPPPTGPRTGGSLVGAPGPGFTTLLLQAQAGEKAAADTLHAAEQQNFPEYLAALATELCDPSRPGPAVRLAGLMLKNAFEDTRSEAAQQRKIAAWRERVGEPHKAHVRACLTKALVSPVEDARKSAAQAVAALGTIDLEARAWPELVPGLLASATTGQLSDDVKVHTLEAMGYLCETLRPEDVPEESVNYLLTGIVENMKEGKSDALRLAATRALYNALEFAIRNMERKAERDEIVRRMCEATLHARPEVRRTGFECVVRMAHLYYAYLAEYMDTFYRLTFNAVKEGGQSEHSARVAQQALEFWATLCETEMDLEYEAREYEERAQAVPPELQSRRYVAQAAPTLFELLCKCCLKEQAKEFAEEDDWTLHMSGATVLGLMAQCVRDDLVDHVLPFVLENIQHAAGPDSWRDREAALMAFGKILDGPSPAKLAAYVDNGLPAFIGLMDSKREPHVVVRDTAAWVLSTVAQLHLRTVAPNLVAIVNAALQGLEDHPHVATTSAFVLQNLAMAVHDESAEHEEDGRSRTNVLSQFVVLVLPRLLKASERADWNEFGLRGNCFEAINRYVEACAEDVFNVIADLLGLVMAKLQQAVSIKVETIAQKEEVDGMLQFCCGTVLAVTHRLGERIAPRAQHIMVLVLAVLSHHNSAACAEAYQIAGGVAGAIGKQFTVLLADFAPHLIRGLRNSDDYQVCMAAAEATSDVARAVGDALRPYAADIVALFLANLANPDLHRDVKPHTLSAIGDLAGALGPAFEPYAPQLLLVMEHAAMFRAPKDDPDLLDYASDLRDANLEAYTGILAGLGRNVATDVFVRGGRIDHVLNFLVSIAADLSNPETRDAVTGSVVKQATGLLGDLIVLGEPVRIKIQSAAPIFRVILDACKELDDPQAEDWARYAAEKCKI